MLTVVTKGRYRLGCPIWGRKDWVGELLSPGARPTEFLWEYAQVFDAVEGNTTFYATPPPGTVERWAEATPQTFRFCFKLPKTITHGRGLIAGVGATERFVDRLRPLGPRLGPIMIQMPPTFGPPRMRALVDFMAHLPRDVTFALELRHPGFFSETPAERRLTQLLIEAGVERVVLDAKAVFGPGPVDEHIRVARQRKPNLPIPTVIEGKTPIIRFMRGPDPDSARARMEAWAARVAAWIAQGREPYVFLHCPNDFYAPRLAREFHACLQERIELEPLPQWPAERVAARAQISLF